MMAPAMDALDVFESQAAFRALLDAASRPGGVGELPRAGLGAEVVPLALADVETSVAVVGDPEREAWVLRATGASPASLEEADLVACVGPVRAAALRRLRRGSVLAPEAGAKVGVECRRLLAGSRGELTLTISGPGVDGHAILGIDGLERAVLDVVAEANSGYPAGIDLWLVDCDARIAGLPRSASWKVS